MTEVKSLSPLHDVRLTGSFKDQSDPTPGASDECVEGRDRGATSRGDERPGRGLPGHEEFEEERESRIRVVTSGRCSPGRGVPLQGPPDTLRTVADDLEGDRVGVVGSPVVETGGEVVYPSRRYWRWVGRASPVSASEA